MGCFPCCSTKNNEYTYLNGDLYKGEIKNNLPNGKGIKYYGSSNKIRYQGDFVNGIQEGRGKYIWENGEYYIGDWKNDKKNGYGTIFLNNGRIKYQGNFIDDNFIENNIINTMNHNSQQMNTNNNIGAVQKQNVQQNEGIMSDGDYIYGNIHHITNGK